MTHLFRTVVRLTSGFYAIGAGLAMGLIFLIVFFNALGRYVFGTSLAWGDQIPVFLGIYGIMFGMALAYLQDRHVRLGVVVDFLSVRLREWLFFVVDLAMIAIGMLLAWSAYLFMASRGSMRVSGLNSTVTSLREATGLEIFNVLGTMAPYQFALVLGGVMLSVAALLKAIERFSDLRASTTEGT